MKRHWLRTALLALAACSIVSAHAGPLREALKARQEARADESELDDAGEGAASQSLPAGVTAQRDLAYGADAQQRVDAYLPAKPSGHAAVIFMVHGGGWRRGDKAMGSVVTNKVAHWVPQGVVVVSVNYRMLPDANPVEQADDVARALAFAQGKAASWGADPSRFVLMGHSAGAHLVAMLAADRSIATRQGAKPWLGTVALDSAGYDVVKVMEGRHFRLYDQAFGKDPAFWREGSPLHRLNGTPPPLLLVCSSKRSVSCPQAQAFAATAMQLGGRVQVLPEALSHREINATLGEPGRYTSEVDAFLRSLGLQ
jgi:acetyl esterase/lipase